MSLEKARSRESEESESHEERALAILGRRILVDSDVGGQDQGFAPINGLTKGASALKAKHDTLL